MIINDCVYDPLSLRVYFSLILASTFLLVVLLLWIYQYFINSKIEKCFNKFQSKLNENGDDSKKIEKYLLDFNSKFIYVSKVVEKIKKIYFDEKAYLNFAIFELLKKDLQFCIQKKYWKWRKLIILSIYCFILNLFIFGFELNQFYIENISKSNSLKIYYLNILLYPIFATTIAILITIVMNIKSKKMTNWTLEKVNQIELFILSKITHSK